MKNVLTIILSDSAIFGGSLLVAVAKIIYPLSIVLGLFVVQSHNTAIFLVMIISLLVMCYSYCSEYTSAALKRVSWILFISSILLVVLFTKPHEYCFPSAWHGALYTLIGMFFIAISNIVSIFLNNITCVSQEQT